MGATMARTMIDRFRAMAEALGKHPDIAVTTCAFNPPATKGELDEARRTFRLTRAMTSFYRQANGLTLRWERREGRDLPQGGEASGSINLLPVQRAFGEWGDALASDPDEPMARLRPIDLFVEEACAALLLDGAANPQVYYCILGEEMRPLGVTFTGYLNLLLKSRGFWYWHEAIAPNEPATVEAGNFREIMPQLFKDYRESAFRRHTAD
jgi:hypothetical protein